jgi:chaperonin GroEL
MTAYSKVQSVAKNVTYASERLEQLILDTTQKISAIVGATLGPGGRPVLLERQEYGTLPMVTKDGVTVFRALGFDNPDAQNIMESFRDASVRTASEAGDGTTTATVLGAAIVKHISAYCKVHPTESPQKVVRQLHNILNTQLIPLIKSWAREANMGTVEGQKLLRSVATVSANGDSELADAVMKCFDLVGDEGNVTLTEVAGPSAYEIERIEGYPITMGFEDTMGRFAPLFINDQDSQKCVLEDCLVLVYHGRLTDAGSLAHLLMKIGGNWEMNRGPHNVIIVATGFSEQVIASFAMGFADKTLLNIVPVLCPHFPVTDGQLGFLQDLCAVTGQRDLITPLTHRLDEVEIIHLGKAKQFEMARFRSNIIGDFEMNELLVLERVDIVKKQLKLGTVGKLEESYLNERIGKLTGGIARLKIVAPSAGELRERKDRAEDAVCAVRGAIKHGVLPGGAWTMTKLAKRTAVYLDSVGAEILLPALLEPLRRIMENIGASKEEVAEVMKTLFATDQDDMTVYDALHGKYVDAFEAGILDSVPAVLEALRNSLSIASLLGTLGGVVSFKRNSALETSEAKAAQQFERDAGIQTPEMDE